MSERWSDGGTDFGGTFGDVSSNPRRSEQKPTAAETKQVQKALAEPRRRVTSDDVAIDSAIEAIAAEPLLTPRQKLLKRLGMVELEDGSAVPAGQAARLQEEAAAAAEGVTLEEYRRYLRELEAEDDEEIEEQDDGWGSSVESSGIDWA